MIFDMPNNFKVKKLFFFPNKENKEKFGINK